MLENKVLKSSIVAEVPGFESVSFMANGAPCRLEDKIPYRTCQATFDYVNGKWIIYKICDSER